MRTGQGCKPRSGRASARLDAEHSQSTRRQWLRGELRSGESEHRQRTEWSPPLRAIPRAATLYSAGSARDPDHEAVIRFSSRAPRRRTHSQAGIEAMASLGSPPPRIVVGGPVAAARLGPDVLCFRSFCLWLLDSQAGHAAARITTPSGTSPVVARRHSATSNLRASATIIVVLRAPLVPSVRARYQRASALSFWKTRKRQASWMRPRRTRALPALARPFSRRFEPLSSGEPVAPA